MYRNKHILKHAQMFPCMSCGRDDGTVVAAHSNSQQDGKGLGIKASDYRVAYLCSQCHHAVDQGGMSKQQKREVWLAAHYKTIGALFEAGLIEVKA